jgi:hypothetical protein
MVAEADRAMVELTVAWREVQEVVRQRDKRPSPPRSKSYQREKRPSVMSTQECVDWVLVALIEAGYAQSDPVLPDEIGLLLQPIKAAGYGREFDRWLQRRVGTLRVAIAADRGTGMGPLPPEWAHCHEELDGNRAGSVLTLLLDLAIPESSAHQKGHTFDT